MLGLDHLATNTEMVLLALSTRRSSPWTKYAGQDSTEGWALYFRSSALVNVNHRHHDYRESSPYQKVTKRPIPSSSTASGDECHVRKSLSSLRPRVGTVEERMSREVETFTCVFPEFTVRA
jgi:hypothetical protein